MAKKQYRNKKYAAGKAAFPLLSDFLLNMPSCYDIIYHIAMEKEASFYDCYFRLRRR